MSPELAHCASLRSVRRPPEALGLTGNKRTNARPVVNSSSWAVEIISCVIIFVFLRLDQSLGNCSYYGSWVRPGRRCLSSFFLAQTSGRGRGPSKRAAPSRHSVSAQRSVTRLHCLRERHLERNGSVFARDNWEGSLRLLPWILFFSCCEQAKWLASCSPQLRSGTTRRVPRQSFSGRRR